MGNSNNIVAKQAIPESFYSIVEKDSLGKEVSFEKFRGKVVYGVNVASNCSSTKAGYELVVSVLGLKDKGVEVALFPCNQVS
jgi:glutathione peroxidase-family protein